jgi:predicted phage tail protein
VRQSPKAKRSPATPLLKRDSRVGTRRVRGRAMGAGGKSGSSGGIESKNTLQSKAIVTIIDLLSEGPIGGLVNGAKSIYFNNTPLMTQGGVYNFKGVTYQEFTGTPDQGFAKGFPAATSTVAVGTQILHTTPVEYSISNTACTRATVTVGVPALFVTDTHNGNITPASVQIEIKCAPSDGVQQTILTDTISGKCTSEYERSFTFELPGTGPWSIFVSRPTPDSQTVNLQNATYLDSVNEIVDYQMLYPNSAYIALTFDSSLFGSTLPTRTYDIQGVIVQVPLNYNAATRTYATTGPGTSGGTWDGVSMQPAVTSNPAWICLDLISSNRYGMGLASSVLAFTKWDLYQIAQYCDGGVPDGYGGTEPRYTCNLWMTSRDDAYRVLQTITSIWRGMSYWGAGSLRITADMPAGVAQAVTQADVVDGNFTYEGTALNTRHTTAIVSYLDPTNYWQPTPCVYQDPDLLVQSVIGPNLIQVNAIGATTLGQAYRQGHWLLDSEQHQTETVTYTAGLDHMSVRPGEIIEIHDPAYAGIRYGGRLKSVAVSGSTMALQLDGQVVQESGQTYALDFALIDGTLAQAVSVESWTQNEDGTTTVTVPVQAAAAEAGAQWIMVASNVAPRQFRVIGATIPQPGQVEITALFHDPNKYERVEDNIDLADSPFTVLPLPLTAPLTPPSNITINDYFVGEGSTTTLQTTVGWTAASDYRVVSYDIEASSDQGYSNIWTGEQPPTYEINNLPVANYVFGVRSRDANGNTSAWAFSAQVLINGQPIPPPQVTGITAVGGTRLISLSWNDVGLANLLYYEIWRAPVTDGSVGTMALLTTSSSTSYTDSESTVLLPLTTWAYQVRAVSTLLSDGEFSTVVQAATTTLITSDLSEGIITTAQFAQGISPVGLLTLAGGAPPATVAAAGGVSTFVDETTGLLYRWNGTSFTAAIPAVQVTGELTAAQIATLATSQLTGQITTGQLAAGSVLAEQLGVGSPTNFIWNSCLSQVTDGWIFQNSSGVTGVTLNPAIDSNPPFALTAFGSGVVYAASIPAAGQIYASWDPEFTQAGTVGIPVTPGTVYGGAALVITSNLSACVGIIFYDASGTVVSQTQGTQLTNPQSAGSAISSYQQVSYIETAPSTAVTAAFFVTGINTSGSTQSGSVVFTQAQFGPVPPNATAVGSWQPGGVTMISGGMIQTGSLNANRIVAGTISTDKFEANSVTAAVIAAGAVGATQIAADSIHANMLASDFALFNYLQVGTETVNNLNILGGSISDFYTATASERGDVSSLLTLTITTSANADGSSVTRTGVALLFVEVETTETDGGFPPVQVTLNGPSGALASAYGLDAAQQSITCLAPVTLTTGSTEFTVTQRGSNANYVTATILVFCTSV